MSFGSALAQTLGTAVSSASGTAIDIAKQKRSEALQREGWDRQDARTTQQQDFTAAENEKNRVARAGEAKAGRKFQVDQANIKYGRDKELAAMKGQKPLETKIVNTDQGTFATMGNKVYQVTEQGLMPLDINANQVPAGEEIVPEEGESEESFFSKAKGFIGGLFDSEEPKSMGEAATETQKIKLEDVKPQYKELLDSGAGFGEVDTFIRNSGLDTWDQLQLLGMYAGGSGEVSKRFQKKGGDKFEGKSYGQSEYDKVKEKYPNASDEQVLKSLDAFYNKGNDTQQPTEQGDFDNRPYSLDDVGEFRRQNPGIGFDKAVEILDKYYAQQ
ncbi:hypothetical protein NVP1232O_27 [Vibrio phage 1.232.O._10N.261.51.E11]|nr:hypothetical protein NVP1232O_27 [Vibrio phage 1.232.O._10N.261.51.E11]